MTLEVDLSEFRAAYLAEMEELLLTAEAACSALARALEDGSPARSFVRELLRAVHTMKGISAMMNAEPVVDLAHHLEELLRAVDAADLTLDERRFALLVESVRGIADRTASMREDRAVAAVPAEWLASLRESLAGRGARPTEGDPERDASNVGLEKLEAHERATLEGATERGARAVVLEFVPSPSKAAAGLTIAKVRERLAEIMELVRVLPVTGAVASNAGGLSFAIYGVTTSPDQVLAAALGDAGARVTPIFERAARFEREQGPTVAPERPAVEPAPLASPARSASHLRVDPRRVDDAIEQMSGMLVTRNRLALAVARLEAREAAAGRARSVESRDIASILEESARQLRDARAALLRLRMVPTSELLERMPLVLRDLKRASPKLARFEARGGQVELDKVVADRVFPALVHLLRNAFDHGIETPSDRRAAGKPDEGCIEMTFRATSNSRIELRVRDDGAGIDVDAIARAANEPNVSHGSAVEAAELLALLCRPGLSTRAEASRVSGRGMGMDIVRKTIVEELGGSLTLFTARGEGTTFVADLPITIAVVDGFRVQVGDEIFVVPVALVDEIVEVDPVRVVELPLRGTHRHRIMAHRTGPIALFDVADLLGIGRASAQGQVGLVVRKAGEPVAFAVDRVLGQVETVVRPLEDALARGPCVSGSTDLGDGRARLVLDLLALAALAARRSERRGASRAEARPS